jgi:hypothetical protein
MFCPPAVGRRPVGSRLPSPQRGSRLSRWQGGGFRLGRSGRSREVRFRPPIFQPVHRVRPRSRALDCRSNPRPPHPCGLPVGACRDRRRNAPIPFGVSNRHCSPLAASKQLPHLSANLGAGAHQYAGSAHVSDADPDNPMRITTRRSCDGLFSIASLEPKISRYPKGMRREGP